MKNKPRKQRNTNTHTSLVSCIAMGVFSTVAIFFVLLVIFSYIVSGMKSPHIYLTPLSFFAIYSSSFLGGFIATLKNKGRDTLLCGLISGTISAILLCLTFLIIGAIFNTESAPIAWLFRALTVVFSLFGALLATKKKQRVRHPQKRRNK